MRNRFEDSAQQAAVEAVERRWSQKNATARRAKRMSTLKSCLRSLILLAVLLGGGLFAARHLGLDVPCVAFPDDAIRRIFGSGKRLKETERAHISAFTGALETFVCSDILPWKTAPQEIRPKHAPRGFTYRMLIERKGGACGVYEMVANGKGGVSVRELLPMGQPMKVTLADFRKAKVGAVYLIACGGKVYVSGAETGEAGVALVRRLLAR